MEYFVNNVNVTKCEFYIPETAPNEDDDEFLDVCNFPNLYNSFCEENKNCWYKQLQRIKAECEQLKAENEKLKDEISHLNCTIEDLYEGM